MRDPGLAAVLSAIIPGLGQFYNGRIMAGILWLIITPGLWIGTGGLLGWVCHVIAAYTAYRLRSRSPDAYLCALGYSPNVGGGKFSEVRKHGQRDQPPASSLSRA
jgi:hypothetical protein